MPRNAKDKKQNGQEPQLPKDLAKVEYTEEEKVRVAKYFERAKREPMKFKRGKNVSGKPCRIEVLATDATLSATRFTEALGTPDWDLQTFLLDQVIQTFRGYATSEGPNSEYVADYSNYAMALLNGIQPQDEIEGMLAVQMIAVHNMAMDTMKRAMLTDQTFLGKEASVNHATKMLRTFTTQMEALKRYRMGGQQKVIVEHVNVNEGGQAIVGVVNRGEGNNEKVG